MRTNILLDEKLVKEAFKYTDVSTKRELVDLALREFINNHKRKDVRELLGKINLNENYDYKFLRQSHYDTSKDKNEKSKKGDE